MTLIVTTGHAQGPTAVFRVHQLPGEGVVLNRSWRFRAGDNPAWAQPGLDDRQWQPIDPTRAIQDLPQLEKAGISWLRLRITTGQSLPPVLCYMFQSVASEVYLDGRLLYHFGTISTKPERVRAYNPYAAFSLPLRPATQHVLALRVACQPGLDYEKSYMGRLPSAVRFNLFPAGEIPAIPLFNIESVYLDSFKTGTAFLLFILHLSLFMAYRRQMVNLYATAMYGLMGIQYILRAASDLMHSVEARQILGYGPYAAPLVNGLTLFIFYGIFGMRRGWPFWLTIGSILLAQVSFPAPYTWLAPVSSYYLTVELIRIAALAIRHQQVGARILMAGVLIHVSLEIIFWIAILNNTPVAGHEWLYHIFYTASFLCIPLALSLRLALDHGWISRQLSLKLDEVQELSARNLTQQQHRQQLLARQNELLEQQVEARTKELRQQAEQLKELDAAKSHFVTNLTHEFRTPLALIISPVAKLLESATLPGDIQLPLQTVDRNARHLLNQVNQLLDVARLEEGRMSLTLQPVLLGQLTAQLVDLFYSVAEAKQISLLLQGPDTETPWLMDVDKWNKIVYNLLANALKFTPAGGQVKIRLQVADNQVCLTVMDTGIGIPADKLPFIFDRFFQGSAGAIGDHTSRPFEGTGVGLTLVRELTNLLSGSVVVESKPGKGSKFTVQLPVQPAAQSATERYSDVPQLPVALLSTSKRPSTFADETLLLTGQDNRAFVLIAEDNADLRQFMADELSTRYRVLTADNGQRGWELTQQHLPDVVISDVMMPRMDGLQLSQQIKTTPTTDHIAVVLVTARSTHDNRLEGFRQGADAYLVKPFDLTELRLTLSNLIARQQKLQDHYRCQLNGIIPEREHRSPEPVDPFLERVYKLLATYLDDPRVNVEWLADQLAMNRKTLYRKLQSKLHLSPTELIRTYRLRRASELMRSGKTVTETAYSVGFDSVTYFGQCFKDAYQMTPTEFINQQT